MRRVLVIAWREFKHTVLTKGFIIGGIATPLLLLVFVLLLPALFRPNLRPLSGTVAIVDVTGLVAAAARTELEPAHVTRRVQDILGKFDSHAVKAEGMSGAGGAASAAAAAVKAAFPAVDLKIDHVAAAGPGELAALKEKVRSSALVALVVVPVDLLDPAPPDTPDTPSTPAGANRLDRAFEIFVAADSAPNHIMLLENTLSDAVVRARVDRALPSIGYDSVSTLMTWPRAHTTALTPDGGEVVERAEARVMIPIAFMMLLWMSTFLSGNYLLTSTIEEKSNKVIEVLLSAVSPMQLMAGKVIGQSGVSLVMLVMYAGMGITGLVAAAMINLIDGWDLFFLGVYFVMAYFMIATIMTSVGSAVNELRDAQSLITPAMLVLMIPLMLWYPISESPNGALATVTSFIPPLIPFVMILRVTASSEPVAAWQIIASIIWGYAAAVGMLWMCGRIFRVGVLMYGKPPTPLELLKWVRYS